MDGEWDYPAYHQRIDAAMRSAGFEAGEHYVNRFYPGTGHGERYWSERLETPLLFLLGEVE